MMGGGDKFVGKLYGFVESKYLRFSDVSDVSDLHLSDTLT